MFLRADTICTGIPSRLSDKAPYGRGKVRVSRSACSFWRVPLMTVLRRVGAEYWEALKQVSNLHSSNWGLILSVNMPRASVLGEACVVLVTRCIIIVQGVLLNTYIDGCDARKMEIPFDAFLYLAQSRHGPNIDHMVQPVITFVQRDDVERSREVHGSSARISRTLHRRP